MEVEFVCDRLKRIGYLAYPDNKKWLARTKWSVFEAGYLINDIEPFDHLKLHDLIEEETKLSALLKLSDLDIEVIRMFLSDIHTDMDVMLTWIPEHAHNIDLNSSSENPLKLINRYLLTVGRIPEKLLMYAKKSFLLLYKNKDVNEETKKDWKDNWHAIARSFEILIDKSTKIKQDISPRKEETLLALIGVLTDKYFIGNKYKKPDGFHKTSTIAEDIIDHISKQFPDNHIPHGFKKSNLIEIINSYLDCWNKKRET
ncbi:hypothetical protein GAMM_10125 [Gammaproteobacteria bacterium]